MDRKMPQYLSAPYQLLWFEPDDLGIMVVGYMLAMVFGGIFWLAMIIAPVAYGKVKKSYPKGFLRHLFYFAGWTELKGYHSFYEEVFIE